jgi:signal transduction histidine kinase
MLKNRLFRKLIITYFILITLSLGLLSLITIEIFSKSYYEEVSLHLKNTAYTVRDFIKDYLADSNKLNRYIVKLGNDIQTRITVIDKNGSVLADSNRDYTSMENHNNRPEIISARESGLGKNIRYSHTLSIDMLYLAIPLEKEKPGGLVIRVALQLKQISLATKKVYRAVGITLGSAFLIALVMGFWLVKRIVKPINEIVSVAESISQGDFNRRIIAKPNDEIGKLADTVNLMNLKLQDLFAESAKYEKLRSDFVANASHELRTPLSMIKGYVETLKEGTETDPAKIQEFINIIEKNVNQLDNLVGDLLELSHLEYSKDMVQFKPVKIDEIISSLMEDFTPAAKLKKQEIIHRIEPEIPEIKADPELIRKAIANLIDNAIKYTPEKGRIEITAKKTSEGIKIEVSDTGIGIPEEDLPRIFERFYRVDKSRSREMGGTGLGLAIVKHIMQLHNGSISVRSEIGKGTTFSLILP